MKTNTSPYSKKNKKIETVDITNNIELFKKITKDMVELYEAKNKDYGDSFSKSLDTFGPLAGVVRMEDKMNRIKTLLNTTALVNNESIEDTLIDLANYSIMTYMWITTKK